MKLKISNILASILVVVFAGSIFAEESSAKDQGATSSWSAQVQKKYELSNEQIKTMTDSKLSDPDMVRVAQLSKSSGKSIEDILKMRSDQKMGWGKIAKELGVSPKEIGHAVSDLKSHGKSENEKPMMEKRDHKEGRERREDHKEHGEEHSGKSEHGKK